MSFCFYPQHEFACPNLRHCPHLGGAALGTLVMIANSSEAHQRGQASLMASKKVWRVKKCQASKKVSGTNGT